MVANAPQQNETLQDALIYTDSRKQMVSDWDRNIPYASYPVLEKSRKTSTPFTLNELWEELGDYSLSKLMPETMREAVNLLVPVSVNGKLAAIALFTGNSPDNSPVARASLQVAAHCALEAMEELKEQKSPQSSVVLSVRETQCLSYIATGHEDEQISRLLGISPRTVRFHVDSAKAKLGVTSRVQAVTKALRERIITV
jgi:DNA-binding CsgD family transcriptional regulator